MVLEEVWAEVSLNPPSTYRTRDLVRAAHTAALAADTERSRKMAPSIAALYFDTAQSAAELIPVVTVVCDLAAALDRSPQANSEEEPEATLQRACAVATQLADRLRGEIDEDPQSPASSESCGLAASVVSDLLAVHRVRPSVESFHMYAVVGMAVYSLLTPSA